MMGVDINTIYHYYYLLIDSSSADNTFTNGLGNWISNDFIQRTGSGPYNNVGPREGVIGAGT